MVIDGEERLLRDMADLREQVPEVQGEVKSLKRQFRTLKKSFDQFELMGFQEQITSLDSKLKKVDSILLGLERDVAKTRIRLDLFWTHWSLTPINNTNSNDCIRFAREEASASLAEINTSLNPHKIAEAWLSQCNDYFQKHGGFEVL